MIYWQQLLMEEKHNWTEESDEMLFTKLEAFAGRIIETCSKVQTDLDALLQKTTAATTQAHCAFSSLANLSDTHSVTNILSEKTPEQPARIEIESVPSFDISANIPMCLEKTQMKEDATLLKHQLALQIGLAGLKIDTVLEDNSHEDISRVSIDSNQLLCDTVEPMPPIIGTPEFDNDEWIGIYKHQEIKDIENMSYELLEPSDPPVSTSKPTNQSVQAEVERPIPSSVRLILDSESQISMNERPSHPVTIKNSSSLPNSTKNQSNDIMHTSNLPPITIPINNPPSVEHSRSSMPIKLPGIAPPSPPPVPNVKSHEFHQDYRKVLQQVFYECKKIFDDSSMNGLNSKDALSYEGQARQRVLKITAEKKRNEMSEFNEDQLFSEEDKIIAELYGDTLAETVNIPSTNSKEQPAELDWTMQIIRLSELTDKEEMHKSFKNSTLSTRKLGGSMPEEEEKLNVSQKKEIDTRQNLLDFLKEEDEEITEMFMKNEYAISILNKPSKHDKNIRKNEPMDKSPPIGIFDGALHRDAQLSNPGFAQKTNDKEATEQLNAIPSLFDHEPSEKHTEVFSQPVNK